MSQSLTKKILHIIFSTKNREPFLHDKTIRKEMHAYLASRVHDQNGRAIIVNGTADHVHILCVLAASSMLSKVAGETKRTSSKWIKSTGVDFSSFYWQRGYAAFSVSFSLQDRAQRYIDNQDHHHKKKTFKEEYLHFVQQHKVDYDERYMWD